MKLDRYVKSELQLYSYCMEINKSEEVEADAILSEKVSPLPPWNPPADEHFINMFNFHPRMILFQFTDPCIQIWKLVHRCQKLIFCHRWQFVLFVLSTFHCLPLLLLLLPARRNDKKCSWKEITIKDRRVHAKSVIESLTLQSPLKLEVVLICWISIKRSAFYFYLCDVLSSWFFELFQSIFSKIWALDWHAWFLVTFWHQSKWLGITIT